MSFIQDSAVKAYVSKVQAGVHNGRQRPSLLTKVLCDQELDSELKDILRSLLEFNPYFRKSTEEILASPYFDTVRNLDHESFKPSKLFFDIDKDGVYDYDKAESTGYSLEDLAEMVETEISQI